MKKILLILVFLTGVITIEAQRKPFRFAFLSDTHIGSPDGSSEEDLRRSVRDINAMDDIAFVVITGDITELGTNEQLKLAKRIFDSLRVTYYIIPGNHDSGWSESGGVVFTTIFAAEAFDPRLMWDAAARNAHRPLPSGRAYPGIAASALS